MTSDSLMTNQRLGFSSGRILRENGPVEIGGVRGKTSKLNFVSNYDRTVSHPVSSRLSELNCSKGAKRAQGCKCCNCSGQVAILRPMIVAIQRNFNARCHRPPPSGRKHRDWLIKQKYFLFPIIRNLRKVRGLWSSFSFSNFYAP